MKKILLFFSFLMLINLYALDCKNAYSTADMNECENLKYIQADKKLNETYKKLISKLDPEAKELLKKAQKAWIVYRDSNADFNADSMRGGSGQSLLHISTSTDMTIKREEELSSFLRIYEY